MIRLSVWTSSVLAMALVGLSPSSSRAGFTFALGNGPANNGVGS
jgi:hypothetical protein